MIEKYESKYKINYHDIDQTGFATVNSLIEYMQENSAMHSNIAGFDVEYIKDTGLAWLVLEIATQIYFLPKLDEEITIKTWCSGIIRGIYAYRKYEITNSNGEVLAESNSKWIIYSSKKNKVVKIPQEVLDMYINVGDIEKEGFIDIPDTKSYDRVEKRYVLYRDVDTNWHMNNTKYVKLAMETMDNEFLKNNVIEKYSVKYIKQLVYKENMNICIKQISENEYMYYFNQNGEKKNNCEIYIKWKRR